ncbi:hypothetical protein [Malonomonas rubra]|uniref:hypothetical protein n=1 Tax=Malonomonas rubra TaxID=57040 RepID=UPI0026EAE697|nr:hypothetical protein [Malonomonas rubra]
MFSILFLSLEFFVGFDSLVPSVTVENLSEACEGFEDSQEVEKVIRRKRDSDFEFVTIDRGYV